MVRTFSVGYDHGNSTTTAVINLGRGEQKVVTFPSATARGNLELLAKARRASGDESSTLDYQLLKEKEYILEYDERVTYIGELALSQGEHPSTGRKDGNRYSSLRNLECLLAATASSIPDTTFELLVVTGLPYMMFNEVLKKSVKSTLNGSYHFQLNGRERQVFVKVGKVLAEGAGAALLHTAQNDLPKDSLYGVIDIGGYSTDLYVTQGLEAQVLLCGGISAGVEAALDQIAERLATKYHFHVSERNKQRIVDAYLTGLGYPSFANNGKTISSSIVKDITTEEFRRVGERICEFISGKWRRGDLASVATDFDCIEVVGGGPYYFLSLISEKIPLVQMVKSPETANARGYAWFAEQLLVARKATA